MPPSAPLVRPTITYFAERGSRDGSSPSESFGAEGSSATRKFFVPWDERFLAATAILGYSQIGYDGSAPDGLRRLIPLRHPDTSVFPYYWYAASITNCTGHKFSGKRTGSDSSVANTFDKAELTVQYEQVDYLMFNDSTTVNPVTGDPWTWPTDEWVRYTSIGEMTTSTNYLALPGGTIQYARNPALPLPTAPPHGKPIPFATGIVQPIMEFKLTWKKVPFQIVSPYLGYTANPWKRRIWGDGTNTYLPYIGTVNKTSFLKYPAGTLLFSNIRMIPRKSPYLVPEWDVEFTFAVDPRKWNYKLYVPPKAEADNFEYYLAIRPTSGTTTWYDQGSIPDYKCLYNEREFTELFQVY